MAGPFREWPDLQCLACSRGALEPDISEIESKVSADSRAGAETLEGPARGFFHGVLACSRLPCGNKYVVAGEWTKGSGNPDEDSKDIPDDEADYIGEYDPQLYGFTVRHVLPPLPLITLPEKTPKEVAALVDSASSELLSDPSSAAARIRTAVEALLDKQGVRKLQINSRTKYLSTHARIELFRARNAAAADQLEAVKWIGNAGAHERNPLSMELVLDGIDFFARAVEIIYDPREADLARRAAAVNRNRGRNLRPSSRNPRTGD